MQVLQKTGRDISHIFCHAPLRLRIVSGCLATTVRSKWLS